MRKLSGSKKSAKNNIVLEKPKAHSDQEILDEIPIPKPGLIFGLSAESMDLLIHLRTSVRMYVRANFPENPRIRIFGIFVLKNEKNK